MSDPKPAFDPLHRWLGIPPEEQPPNHYRLLGLKPFEDDPNVIEAAADQRMSYVRQSATGKNAQHSHSVLNALSAARVCLLNAEAKHKYDAELKPKIQKREPKVAQAIPLPEAAATPPAAVLVPAENPLPFVVEDPHGPTGRKHAPVAARRKAGKPPYLMFGVVGGGLAGIGILVAVVAALSNSNPQQVSQGETKVRTTPAPKPSANTVKDTQPAKKPAAEQPRPKATNDNPKTASGKTQEKNDEKVDTITPVATKVQVPVLAPSGEKKLLLIMKNPELETAKEACRRFNLNCEEGTFEDALRDHTNYHTILCGSNSMDYFGAEDRKQPDDFDPLKRFVERGGHLIVFGSFNGRNLEHFGQFGITAGFRHSSNFLPVEEHADVLFRGVEDLVPKDRHLTSAGHFTVSRPHVVLLRRDDDTPEPGPALITMPVDSGRLTFTQAEPFWKGDLWLVTVLCSWVARGAPTRWSDREHSMQLASTKPDDSPGPRGGLETLLEPRPKSRRTAVPSGDELAKAEAAVQEIFGDQLKLKSAAEKKKLVETMLSSAGDSLDKPAEQYALLQQAYQLAIASKDLPSALQAASGLEKFEVDGLALKLDALLKLGKALPKDAALLHLVVRSSLDLTADLIDADDYEHAAKIAALAESVAPRTQNRHYTSLTAAVEKRVKLLAREYQRVAAQAELLKTMPEDPAANEELGKFYCLIKRTWSRGLPLLARGSDDRLRRLAERELMSTPQDSEVLQELGDQWSAAANDLSGEQRTAATMRARLWYQRALATAKSVARAEIEAKLLKIPSPKFQLAVQVKDVDGRDELCLSADRVFWRHLNWGMPSGAVVNDLRWNLDNELSLPNRGATQLLPPDLDFSTVRVQKLRGRGVVKATGTEKEAIIYLDDRPFGADTYEFLVTFGQ